MSCRKRLTARLVGSVFVVLLGAGCAETGTPFSVSSPQQTGMVDHALTAAKAARANGDLNSAAAKLAYLVSIAPDNADVLAEYAKALTEMGRPDEALVYFRRAMERDPQDWKLYNAEAVAYDEKGNYAASADDYDTALKLMPGEPVVINHAARSRMAAGDLKGAEALLAQANLADRGQGYLADTQSHLAALEVAQRPVTPVASAAPQPIEKDAAAAAVAPMQMAAQTAPAATSVDAPAPSSAPVTPAAAPAQAATVAMNTTTAWAPPAAPTTAPTTIDASQTARPAPAVSTPDSKPAAPPAAASNEATASAVIPAVAAGNDAKAVSVADAQPGAPSSASAPPLSQAPMQADSRRYHVRVATFRSRRHARHVAARLRPRDVHIARFIYRGRRYYRVWIADAGTRGDAEVVLQTVEAMGFHHARLIARAEPRTNRRLAQK